MNFIVDPYGRILKEYFSEKVWYIIHKTLWLLLLWLFLNLLSWLIVAFFHSEIKNALLAS